MQIPQYMQKLFSAGTVDMDPRKKASPSVTDVIVIDGAAWAIPYFNLFSTDRCIGV